MRLIHACHCFANLREQGRVKWNPLSPEANEPFITGDQLGKFGLRKIGIANGNTPIEINKRVKSEQRAA